MFTILHLPIYLSSSYLFEFFIEKLISTFRIGGTNRIAKLNSTKSNQSTSSLKRSLQLKNQLYIVRKEKKKGKKNAKKNKIPFSCSRKSQVAARFREEPRRGKVCA